MSLTDNLDLYVRHFGIIGNNLDEMEIFYRELGFTFHNREMCIGKYIEELSGKNWSSAEIIKLKNNENVILELICPTWVDLTKINFQSTSWSHIAITVHDDLNSKINKLKALGAVIQGGPVLSPNGPYMVCYLRDPWNNLIELTNPLLRNH